MESSHEYGVAYDSKRRFVSYWHQIREILLCTPPRSALSPRLRVGAGAGARREHVLEIGKGNGFVSRYVRGLGISVTTVDSDEALKPDVVADVSHLPFPDASHDIVTAYEVLEHMSYEKSLRGLREVRRVSSRWVIVSLPDATHAFRFAVTIPRIGYFQKVISAPFFFPRKHPYAKSHEWEVGIQGYHLSRILEDMKKMDLQLVKTYRVYENPYHRFFVLRKS